MSIIPDESLHDYSDKMKGKVVLITGGAAGIGRATALKFAKYGAKIVIGDWNGQGAQGVVEEIRKTGGTAVSLQMNVINWDEQVALFELAIATFNAVDVVIANAGATELTSFTTVKVVDGLPAKPKLKTLEVNVTGTAYTTHLAIHYLQKNRVDDSFKAIVLMASMASWQAFPVAEQYCASKHAILGLGRSIAPFFERRRIRMSLIHPWFSDTAILPLVAKIALAGIPLTPVERTAGAIFYATTEPDGSTSGDVWLVQSNEPVCKLEPEQLKAGVYKLMDERFEWVEKHMSTARTFVELIRFSRRGIKKKHLAWISVPILAVVLYFGMSK